MKTKGRVVVALMLAMLLLLSLCGSALAVGEASKPAEVVVKVGDQGTVNVNALNMRSGAGTSYKVVGVLKRGNVVTVQAVRGNWRQVITTQGKTVYVYYRYITLQPSNSKEKDSASTIITATPAKPTNTKPSTELLVSAAASLTDAMGDIAKLYNGENNGVKVTLNLGSSGALQQQIEQGAPADIFVSAASKQMNALDDKGLILRETKKDLLKNRMVLVVPKNSNKIKDFGDLTQAKVIALGEPASVPAGKYGQEVLTKLGLWEKLSSKMVYAKDVRQVLAYVESGDADAGIVYRTDALISDKVKVAAIAEEKLHSPVVYPVAVIKDSKNPKAARDFVKFLSGDNAQVIFEKYGFTIVK